MDIKKIVLYMALALVGVALWNAWMRDYPPASIAAQENATTSAQKGSDFTPPSYNPTPQANAQTSQAPIANNTQNAGFVEVKTDVLDVVISNSGGNLISAKLLRYPVSLKTPDISVQILNNNPDSLYTTQMGLTSNNAPSAPILFHSDKKTYSLASGENQSTVKLTGENKDGLAVTKIFTFTKGKYAIDTELQVKNNSNKNWTGSLYQQITRKYVAPVKGLHSRSYDGAAVSSPEQPYEKLTYKNMDENNFSRDVQGGWVAMQQQYFLSAWVPSGNQLNHYYTHTTTDSFNNKIYVIGYVGPQQSLAANQEWSSKSTFYVGPELEDQLRAVAKNLDLTIDYGWLWPISKLIFWVMEKIYRVIGNWGWSIILVTLLIKIVFYPFSDKSYKSMVKMRNLQPRMQELKERYANDKQAMSRAVMELYKKEKVNPMGGCLPMIIQIPVFIALYYVLIESVQLRQAPFIFWIQDLSIKDPYYVLPILMGLSMLLQQKLSPAPPDPTQAKMMMLLPVFFTVFLLSFPSGLVLYWLTNNIISVLQQWYVMKTYHPQVERKYSSTKKKKVV